MFPQISLVLLNTLLGMELNVSDYPSHVNFADPELSLDFFTVQMLSFLKILICLQLLDDLVNFLYM